MQFIFHVLRIVGDHRALAPIINSKFRADYFDSRVWIKYFSTVLSSIVENTKKHSNIYHNDF